VAAAVAAAVAVVAATVSPGKEQQLLVMNRAEFLTLEVLRASFLSVRRVI
jgi:hypothetical protein